MNKFLPEHTSSNKHSRTTKRVQTVTIDEKSTLTLPEDFEKNSLCLFHRKTKLLPVYGETLLDQVTCGPGTGYKQEESRLQYCANVMQTIIVVYHDNRDIGDILAIFPSERYIGDISLGYCSDGREISPIYC